MRLGRPFVKVDTFGMVNLIAGSRVVPELIQDDCNGPALAREVGVRLDDEALRRDQIARQNVENSLAEVINGSAYLRDCIQRGEMGLVGAYHDIAARTVQFGDLVTGDKVQRYRASDSDLAA